MSYGSEEEEPPFSQDNGQDEESYNIDRMKRTTEYRE